MVDIEISTYWNVETLYYVFNGVAAIMAGAGFAGLLKMVFLFALMLGMFHYAGNRQLELATWFIQALIFTTILNLPIARVALTDRTGLEPPRVVDNVPIALALVGQMTTLAFGWATQTYETVFGVPDQLGLQQGDLAFGHRILKNVNQAIIRDPGLRADLMQFIKECTLYDIKDGAITPDQVIGQTDTWNTLFANTSPARFVTYNTLTPAPVTDTCTAAAGVLKAKVDAGVAAAQSFYGRQAFTRADSDALAASLYAGAVGTSYDWILASSSAASDAMKQAMFNNLWREAGAELPALMNDPARIQELQNMAGAAQAARQADGTNATLSMLAQETLPHMRNWLEAILYAAFPIMVAMMVVVSTEGAKKLIGGYLMSLAWIGMWPVMFAVINHLSLMHLRHKMAALHLANGVPFQLSDVFDATLSNEQAAIGYLVVLVPFLCGALIKMGQGGFMSVADKMVSGFTGAGSAVGASMASGNVSLGQAGLDTASVNSTSLHKYDSTIGLTGGGASIGYGNGGTGAMAANGNLALQQFHNRLLSSMAVDSREQSERAEEGHASQMRSRGQQSSVRHAEASSLASVVGHDQTRGAGQQVGATAQVMRSGAQTGSHGGGERLEHALSDRSGFTASAGALDTGFMGATAGGGGGAGAGGAAVGGNPARPGLPGEGVGPSAAGEKRIAQSLRQGGASQGEIDAALGRYRADKPAGGAAGKAGGTSRGIGVNLGLQSQKNYSAQQSRDRSDASQHAVDESARLERSFAVTGQRAVSAGQDQHSAQNNRLARDATRSTVDERGVTDDVATRREEGIGSRSSHSRGESFTMHRELLSDPSLLERVARRNDMSAVRFMGQEEGRVMAMVRDYVAERGIGAASSRLHGEDLAGNALPTTAAQVDAGAARDAGHLPDRIDALHRTRAGRTGFMGVGAVQADTSLPAIAPAMEAAVRGQLDPAAAGSLAARAVPLDAAASAWASPDRKVGAGRANPMGVVEDMEIDDVKDTGSKLWDKLTGSDRSGTNQLTENQKRETGVSPPVGPPP